MVYGLWFNKADYTAVFLLSILIKTPKDTYPT